MSKFMGTLIGGGIGWILAGPLGALLGGWLGSKLASDDQQTYRRIGGDSDWNRGHSQSHTYADTRSGDFAIAMLALFAHISRADGRITSSEVRYVKQYLIEKFGADNARDLMMIYKEIINKTYNLNQLTGQIRRYMDYYTRLELIHILFGIAKADGVIQSSEINEIRKISVSLGISDSDYRTIETLFVSPEPSPFDILNVKEDDSVETIKKAYRNLATKYHPDKVASLGPEIRQVAEEKFKAINEAYQKIRKIRGF